MSSMIALNVPLLLLLQALVAMLHLEQLPADGQARLQETVEQGCWVACTLAEVPQHKPRSLRPVSHLACTL